MCNLIFSLACKGFAIADVVIQIQTYIYIHIHIYIYMYICLRKIIEQQQVNPTHTRIEKGVVMFPHCVYVMHPACHSVLRSFRWQRTTIGT